MSGIPLAVSPTSPTPGLALVVNLKPTTVAPGSQPIKALIIGPAGSGGDITDETEIRSITSQEDIETAADVGSLPALAYAALVKMYPVAQVDYVACAESGGNAATGSITYASTATEDRTVHLSIQTTTIDIPWLAGEDLDDMRAKTVTYVGRYAKRLFVTATASATTGVVTLTANGKGPAGNDVRISVTVEGGAGGTVTASAATLTGGTTEPDYTNALALVEGYEYDFIGLCLSNTDVASTTGNFSKLKTHINGVGSGLSAKLQQGVAGCTGLRTAVYSAAAALNEQFLEIKNVQLARDLPCEIMGDEIGDRMYGVVTQYSMNRIWRPSGCVGAADKVTNKPTANQSDAALLAGIALGSYDATGQLCTLRAITTYSQTPQGAAVLPTDCNEIDAMYLVGKDIRSYLPTQYIGVKVTRDQVGNEDPLPDGVVEERDIRSTIAARVLSFWCRKGTINKTAFEESINSGELAVAVNDTDETQVDIYLPLKPFKNLAKMGVYVQKTG